MKKILIILSILILLFTGCSGAIENTIFIQNKYPDYEIYSISEDKFIVIGHGEVRYINIDVNPTFVGAYNIRLNKIQIIVTEKRRNK